MKNKYVFMAFAKGNEQKEFTGSFKKYEGFGISKILAVNPNKAELEKILGREIANEPVYVDKDANGVDRVKLSFVMQTVPEKNGGIEIIVIGNLWLYKQPRTTEDGRTMYIDRYGNVKWLQKDELKSPIAGFDSASARIACKGEDELVSLIRTFRNIESAVKFEEGKGWSFKEPGEFKKAAGLVDCEGCIDNVAALFNGDFTEIKDAISDKPDNTINVVYYVSSNDNKEYQNVCLNRVANPFATNLNYVKDNILNKQDHGSFQGVKFNFSPLHEYTVVPTQIPEKPAVDNNDLPW